MAKPLKTAEFLCMGRKAIQSAAARAGIGPLAPGQLLTRDQAAQIMAEIGSMGGTPVTFGLPLAEARPCANFGCPSGRR